jgi:hypothetical protein
MPLELTVKILRVPYPPATADPESFYILVTDQGTCKGTMSWRPRESDQLILDGEWTTYHGEREFKFKGARIDVPTNPRDMLHYVCTRTVGLGPAAESQIWDKLGAAWETATEGCTPRLKGRVFAEFQLQIEGLHGKSEEARVVATLVGKGATANMASAAWAMWGKETLGVVQADPYRLAELPNYSYQDVDRRIRREYGITDSDPRRIRSAVIYALRRLTDAGDTVVSWEDLFSQACGMLGGYSDEIMECAGELFNDGTIKAFSDSEGVSLKADWDAENEIWKYVESIGKVG